MTSDVGFLEKMLELNEEVNSNPSTERLQEIRVQNNSWLFSISSSHPSYIYCVVFCIALCLCVADLAQYLKEVEQCFVNSETIYTNC